MNLVSEKNKRVILKVTMVSEEANNFIFTGTEALNDRTAISEGLTRALAARPAQPVQADSTALTAHDVQLRQALLANPKYKELKQLHQDLVIGGILTEQDFWASRKELLVNQEWQMSGQKKGTSSASLVDIKRAIAGGSSTSADGEPDKQEPTPTTTKIKFTPEIIHSILVQYPSVHAAYEKYVPTQYTEKQFWTQYIVSKHFDSVKSGKPSLTDATKEIFTEAEQDLEDDKEPIFTKRPRIDTSNHLLDLSTTLEDHLEYGNAPDTTMKPGRNEQALPIIRRINRHSTVILKTAGETATQPPSKIYDQETVLEDLVAPQTSAPRPLTILQKNSYFGGVTETTSTNPHTHTIPFKSTTLKGWTPNLQSVSVNPTLGGKIFKSLNQSGARRKIHIPTCKDTPGPYTPTNNDIPKIQSAASELLRHYHAFHQKLTRLSPTSDSRLLIQQKLAKLHAAIEKVYGDVVMVQRSGVGEVALLEGVKRALGIVCGRLEVK
ncbi:hypothetical protein BCR33DRAFT_710867 [Rhizoclosmatium globosum]|uniref:BSD domain-containing protein n=1 Tax=Rhizoclosmatium globosum TaxID=329046 RepID=A0A1Y2D2T5_9FUNG|nr:hypothetical protein BCR33DRAFT_710867 [Rhizoclosmatium globosum]|eukprot:ORY53434.1 hypothetical protein BCR33DRAFT_710867 [Rhizoclosmatium globosum]